MMTAEAQTCPFCNALVPASAAAATGRTICPRCGESFVAPPTSSGSLPTQLPVPDSVNDTPAPQLLQAAPPNRPGQLAALGGAVLVFSFLLRTVLAGYVPAQKAFPFMVGLASLGLIGAVWLW